MESKTSKNWKKQVKYDKNGLLGRHHSLETTYIINFILKTFQLPYNEDFLRLICESSIYINKVNPFFGVEISASKKNDDISKIRNGKNFFCDVPKANKILRNVVKFQVNAISFSNVMTFFI